MTKRIVIAGGSGFLGQSLQAFLNQQGYDVRILTRRCTSENHVQWDAKTLGDWQRELCGAEAIINMTGKSVDCRYHDKNKAEIINSRVDSTRVLHDAVSACDSPPRIWLNSSTATIYEDTRGKAPANTESSQAIGDDFSMGVAKTWEKTFFEKDHTDTVQTALRTAIVMGNGGGAFPIIHKIARFGLCSPQGRGDQWISWLHVNDFCRAVLFLLDTPLSGCVNLCAPNPTLNCDFNQLMKEHVRPWFTLPQPEWLLKFGAIFLRTETELILKSRKVYPARLLEAGFQFHFVDAGEAIKDLLR